MSGNSDPASGVVLLDFLVRLAVDPEALGAFVIDPDAAVTRAGLTRADRSTLFSGDQNRIYAALVAPRPPRQRRRRQGGR